MNYYGLPEFVAYCVLVGIACVLIRQQRQAHLGYWLFAWILILVHSMIYMLLPSSYPYDVLGRGTLTIAAQAFMLAGYYRTAGASTHWPNLLRMGVWGLTMLVFAVTTATYGDAIDTEIGTGPFYLLTGLGAAAALWLLLGERRRRSPAELFLSIALIAVVYGIQIAALALYGVTMASQWAMCWTYLAVAWFFVRSVPRPTMGVAFTALSFVLWGIVFPVYALLGIYAPNVLSNIESEVWNLPKFLAAASMILVLLEEKVAAATRLAGFDELTGLPNRRQYQERFDRAVERATRKGTGFIFLIIDLNRFKQVNDTLGHQAGDDLLRAVSSRFAGALRATDLVARTGGDEFTVIVEGTANAADAEALITSLQQSLAEPVSLGRGVMHQAGASIGAAHYPSEATTETALLALADERMYAAKERSRGGTPVNQNAGPAKLQGPVAA